MTRSWKMSRRTTLRAVGASIALPFLEQMLPRKAQAQAKGPRRFVAMFKPNGTNMAKYLPTATGKGYALTPILMPLAPFKEKTTVVTGVNNKIAGPAEGFHYTGIVAWLTGVHVSPTKVGISVDQVIANAWKGQTTFPSLELGLGSPNGYFNSSNVCDKSPCKWGNMISWADERTPKPTETNPQALFDRLFTGFTPPAPGAPSGPDPALLAAAEKRRAYDQSVLDAVKGQIDRLKAKVGPSDKRRLDSYFTSVREVEGRLTAVPTMGGVPAVTAGCTVPARPARPSVAGDRLKVMTDMIALALQCDRTRVVTFMMGEAESEVDFSFLGIQSEAHHEMSHHGKNATRLAGLEKIDTFYMSLAAQLAAKLDAVQEPDGTALDNSVILHGTEVSDGDEHSLVNVPVVLVGKAGGAIPGGSHVAAGDRPLAELHLTLLRALGVDAASFAGSTATLNLGA